MASDAALRAMDLANPCCALWKTKFSKMEEKRNALRQGVEILKGQIDRLQQENLDLKKASDEVRARANVSEEEKGKETCLRISMEKEIAALKSEISSVRCEAVSLNEDLNKEVALLRACLSDRQAEIDHLKWLLTEEERKVDAEREHTDLEKNKAAELQVALEHEKNRADQARQMADAMEKEIAAVRSETSSADPGGISGMEDLSKEVVHLRTCISERELEIERLKQLLIEQERKADAERQRAELEGRKAVELQEALADEKSRADEVGKTADALGKKVKENSAQLETLKNEVEKTRLKYEEANKKLEAEKQKVAKEKKRVDEERARVIEQRSIAEQNEKQMVEERQMADAMEKEIAAVRSETSSADPGGISGMEDLSKEVVHLRTCISERELEIERLKQLLIEQERKADAERQRAELEGRKAVELQEALADEKSRADEVGKTADALGKKVKENSAQLETLKNEVEKTRLKYEEANKKLEAEKQKVAKEKKRVDEERARVIEQRSIAEQNEKQMVEEKSRASNLLMQLEGKQRDVEKLQKDLQEIIASQKSAWSSELDEVKRNLEAEKKKYAREKKRADDEMCKREELKKVVEASTKKSIEEKHRADNLSQELQSSIQRVEYLEQHLREVNNMLEVERKKASREEKRAGAEKLKSDEQEKIAGENRRMAAEEKFRADNLLLELENNRKKLQDMENELQELKLHGKLGEASYVPPVVTEYTSEVQFLRKQLKFEKQRVKHAKEVAELEKDRKNIVQEEIFRLRNGLQCLLHQFDAVTDIGARNGANNVSKKSGLSDVHTGVLSRRMLPSHVYLCDDAEFRMSTLSSRDASCLVKEKEGFVPAVHCTELPSGMEPELDLLLGGSRGETLSSALNSNTASFSDEQLVGSQERVARSLTTSAVLLQEMTNLQSTTPMSSNECHKPKNGEKVGVVAENSVRSPVKATAGHAIKKRKILDELESIKSMQSEGKRIFEEIEKKLSVIHSTLFKPMVEEMDKETSHLAVCVVSPVSNYDKPNKKRKASHEPEATCQHIDDPGAEAGMDKHATALTASKRPKNSLVLQDASRDIQQCHEDVASFEVFADGDYMKLLNLDNAVDEECYRTAMERPLSPTLPEIDLRNGETGIDAQMLSMQVSNIHEAEDQCGSFIHNLGQLHCIVFSDMEENSSINRIFSAVRVCAAQCCLFRRTSWLVHHILAALRLEKDLRPREKVCALFSLILLNFLRVSPGNLENLQIKDLMNSFSAHIRSVLYGVETRGLFAEICDVDDLLGMCEDFVLCRRILLRRDTTSGSLHDSSLSFEILHEGEKIVLSQHVAPVDMVMAGSIVLASICAAIGNIGYLCEVSFNVLCICATEDQMMLGILHMFVHVCGEEYFSSSNYGFMEVVKSVVTYVERTFANIAATDVQSRNDTKPCFMSCVRCPFSEGSLSLDDVSAMLMRELQSYCLGTNAIDEAAGQVHLSTRKTLCWNLGDILSSLELITSKMGWSWACNNIVPKLLKIFESCNQGRVSSAALVTLLGELGRFGIKEGGYDNIGVENIKCKLLDTPCRVHGPKCNAFAMSVVSALVGLHPKGHEEFVNNDSIELPSKNGGHSASGIAGILRDCLPGLRSEQVSSLLAL